MYSRLNYIVNVGKIYKFFKLKVKNLFQVYTENEPEISLKKYERYYNLNQILYWLKQFYSDESKVLQ